MDTRQRGKGGAHSAKEQHQELCDKHCAWHIFFTQEGSTNRYSLSVPGQPLIGGCMEMRL